MKHKGKFDPPSMGDQHVPIDISGDGFLEQSDSGLHVKGFLAKGVSSSLLALGFFAVFFGFVILATYFRANMDGNSLAYLVFTPLIGFLMKSRKSTSTDALEFKVPWKNIKSIAKKKNQIEILVKGQRPSGMVHFVPYEDMDAGLAQLQEAHEKTKLTRV